MRGPSFLLAAFLLACGADPEQATVHVDEDGMIAAASTQVFAYLVSVPTPFIADRDFVFLVRDRLTGAILFTGRVSDPRQSSPAP